MKNEKETEANRAYIAEGRQQVIKELLFAIAHGRLEITSWTSEGSKVWAQLRKELMEGK